MIRHALLAAVTGLAAGCSQQSEQGQAAASVAVAPAATLPPAPAVTPVPVPQPAPVQPLPVAPMPHAAPTVFEYPTDLGGRAVVKAVTPTIAPLKTGEMFGTAPLARTPPARLLDPEILTKAEYTPPPVLPPKPAEVKPVAPPERVPLDLGARTDAVPAKPTFPVAAGITERARDVNLPPAMPTLGRPPADRVPFDDPTTDAGHAAVVAPVVKVPFVPAGFLKVVVPDPFELGEQIKPKVPPAAEPGLAPVVVNPQRVK